MPWQTSPTFSNGQIISASGHLQALADNTRWLLAGYRRPQTCWPASRLDGSTHRRHMLAEGNEWQRVYEGMIRHKADTLSYGLSVVADSVLNCKVRVTGGSATQTHTISGGSGTTAIDDTLDVSGESGFYLTAVDVQMLDGVTPHPFQGTTEVQPLYIEETDAESYGSLAAFTNGSTPTAAQWQALSDRADTLYAQLGGVSAPWLAEPPARDGVICGASVYRNEYLRYDLRLKLPSIFPAYPETQQYGTWVAVVSYNGTVVGARGWGVLDTGTSLPGTVVLKDATYFFEGQQIKLQTGPVVTLGSKASDTFTGCTLVGTHWRAAGPGDWVKHWPEQTPVGDSEEEYANYTGVFSLTGLGLSEGTRYPVQALAYWDGHEYGDNTTAVLKVNLLSEQPASNPTLTGWSAMPTFAHGDTVTGTASAKTIRDNLTWLSSRVVYANPSTMRRYWQDQGAWFIHRLRWLHYYIIYDELSDTEEPSAEIGWMVGGEWKTDSLPYEPNTWLVHDLWGVAGLLDGYAYRVRLPGYCMEDSIP